MIGPSTWNYPDTVYLLSLKAASFMTEKVWVVVALMVDPTKYVQVTSVHDGGVSYAWKWTTILRNSIATETGHHTYTGCECHWSFARMVHIDIFRLRLFRLLLCISLSSRCFTAYFVYISYWDSRPWSKVTKRPKCTLAIITRRRIRIWQNIIFIELIIIVAAIIGVERDTTETKTLAVSR